MPIYYTSREKEFYHKKGMASFLYGGWFFRIWGAYPVKVGMRNYERSLKTHIRILEEGWGSLCIFPEGGKTKDGTMQPAKGGVAFLAHRTKTPIVPVAISGIFHMSKGDFFSRRRKAVMVFDKPMNTEELFSADGYHKPEEYKKIAQKVMHNVQNLIDHI